LDEITNQTDSPAASRIRIEGPSEQYESWHEVEKLMLPKPLLSMDDSITIDNTEHIEDSTRSIAELYADDASDFGSPTSRETSDEQDPFTTDDFPKYSPRLLSASSSPCVEPLQKVLQPIGTGRPGHKKTDSNASSIETSSTTRPQSKHLGDEVPDSLRPFFNHIMWRIKKDPSTTTQIDSYILLTNDNAKQTVAQRFGIRVKRLEQMRDVIGREDSESKNGLMIANTETIDNNNKTPSLLPAAPIIEGEQPASETTLKDQTEEDEEVILIRPKAPPKAPQAMQKPQSPGKPQLFDPNSFGRGPTHSSRGNQRGRGGFGSPRGASTSQRFTERPPSAGRGALYTVRRGGGQQQQQTQSQTQPQQQPQPPQSPQQQQQPPPPTTPLDLSKPIDPDTFTRATAGTKPATRGGRRRLWEPS
jgi:hypothetical protein